MLPEPFSEVTKDWNLYTTWDEEAPEEEVVCFIEYLVRMIKPNLVVELGTALGYTSQRIGFSLAENTKGKLIGIEIDVRKVEKSSNILLGLPVEIRQGSANSPPPDDLIDIDILFIDAEIENRISNYLSWRERVIEGGIIILHDVFKFDPPRSQLKQIIDPLISFRTPRGLIVCQKSTTGLPLL